MARIDATSPEDEARVRVCINDILRDDDLRAILGKLGSCKDKEVFGLVCKRWLRLQSSERKRLSARAGTHMLHKLAVRFSGLLELDLSQSASRSYYPGITDSDLSVIADGFPSLRVLNLTNCKGISDKGLVAIGSSLLLLQSLDASQCKKITDKGPIAIAEGCHDLRKLHLACCRLITDGILRALSKNCHNLEDLCLQGCTNITDSGLAVLVDGCRKITTLDLNKCNNIGDMGISSVSQACSSSLSALKLLDCYKAGDESISSLVKFCKNLETLVIGGCRFISNEPVRSLASACSNSLKNLRMDWCLNISDSAVNCILRWCRNLEALDIGCCEEVTDSAFQGLGNGGSGLGLKFLKASNCPKITVAGIRMLLNSCSALEYLDVRSCPFITKVGCHEAGLQFPKCCGVNFSGNLSEPDVLLWP